MHEPEIQLDVSFNKKIVFPASAEAILQHANPVRTAPSAAQ